MIYILKVNTFKMQKKKQRVSQYTSFLPFLFDVGPFPIFGETVDFLDSKINYYLVPIGSSSLSSCFQSCYNISLFFPV